MANLPSTIKDVPSNKVGQVVQSFITKDKAVKVTATQQADGTWVIVAQ
jgi:hypothetical protein